MARTESMSRTVSAPSSVGRAAGMIGRLGRRVVSGVLVVGLAAGLLTAAGTAAGAATVTVKAAGSVGCPVSAKLVPSCGPLFGIATDVTGSQTWLQSVAANEQQIGRSADVLHDYHQWNTAFPDAGELSRAQLGQQLMFSWMGQRQDGSQVKWASIASGAEDAVIHAEARRIAAVGRPVYMTFQHEAEALIGVSGTAAEYVAAWRHIHDVFVADGATNAVWAVVFMGVTSDNYIAKVQALYPGDGYVDYIGWDPYNRGACFGNAWQSFSQTIKPFYSWLMANGHGNKPFLLGEFGTVEDPNNAAAKAQWFAGAATALADGEFPNLKVVSYFDHPAPPATCDWRIDSTATSLAGFISFTQDLLTRSTVPVTLPGAPVSVTAVAGTGTAAVTWSQPSNTGHGMITGYKVTASPGGQTATVPGPLPVTNATITGLTAGTSYTFTVTATNSAGTGTASTSSSPVVPAGPRITVPAPSAGGWKLNKLATLVGGNLQLTDSTTKYSLGTAFWPTPITNPTAVTVSFDSTIDNGTGGDGLAVVFGNAAAGATATSTGSSGGGLGFIGIPGVAIGVDTHQSGTDPSGNFIGLTTSGDANKNPIWKATSTNAPTLRAVNHITVVIARGQASVSVNGSQVLSTPITLPTSTLIGFTAGNGTYTDRHQVSNITITAS